jgi:hypothetical protein
MFSQDFTVITLTVAWIDFLGGHNRGNLLPYPKCHGPMAVLAFIEAGDVIEKILKHLGLWELTPRSPPLSPKSQPLSTEPPIDYSASQVPPSDACG